VLEGRQTREQALAQYAAFCEERRRAFDWLLRIQHLVGRVNPTPLMTPIARAMASERFLAWSFGHYLDIAPPRTPRRRDPRRWPRWPDRPRRVERSPTPPDGACSSPRTAPSRRRCSCASGHRPSSSACRSTTIRKLSPVDEAQHLDYVDRVAHGEIPRQGQRLRHSTLRTIACRGVGLAGYKAPPCGQTVLRHAEFPGGAYQYEAQQPPTYYVLTVPLRWVMQNVLRIRDHLDATRAASAIWLIVGLLLLWCAGRLMEVSPAALGAGLLVLVTAGPIIFYHATVSNDATAITGAGVVAFAAATARRSRGSGMPMWLFAAGFFAAACKVTNVLPAAAISALFAVAGGAWPRRRRAVDRGLHALDGRRRRAARRRRGRDAHLGAHPSRSGAHRPQRGADVRHGPSSPARVRRHRARGGEPPASRHPRLGRPARGVVDAEPPAQEALGAVLSYLLMGGALAGLFVSRRRWSHALGLIAVPTLYLGGVALGVAIVRTYGMPPGLGGRYGMSMAPLLAVGLAASLDRGWPVNVVGLFGAVAFVTTLAVLVT
jgi:hypothetical protein